MNAAGDTPRRAGVIGGMGPDATLAFLQKFYKLTQGRREQVRPALLVNIRPDVPDRNDAWRGRGISPAATIAEMGRELKRAGADFCVMACVTAHGYADTFEQMASLPLLRMPDVVADAINSENSTGSVGILATTTTLEMRLFQKAFANCDRPAIVPDENAQKVLMRSIYAIKDGKDSRDSVLTVASSLVARGANTILVGCTDLSTISSLHIEGVTFVDCLDLLAKRTLAEIEGNTKNAGDKTWIHQAP